MSQTEVDAVLSWFSSQTPTPDRFAYLCQSHTVLAEFWMDQSIQTRHLRSRNQQFEMDVHGASVVSTMDKVWQLFDETQKQTFKQIAVRFPNGLTDLIRSDLDRLNLLDEISDVSNAKPSARSSKM